MKYIDITKTEEIKDLIIQMIKFVGDFENTKKDIENKIYIEEGKQNDYLHELELGKLNSIELVQVAKKLKEVRRDRRHYKDILDLLNTLKPFVDKYITKGIYADSKLLIDNVDKLINNQNLRSYTPKVIKDLKCAKEKEKKD